MSVYLQTMKFLLASMHGIVCLIKVHVCQESCLCKFFSSLNRLIIIATFFGVVPFIFTIHYLL